MNKVQDFFKMMSGSELPKVRVAIDPATLVNLFICIVMAGTFLMLVYFLLFYKKS